VRYPVPEADAAGLDDETVLEDLSAVGAHEEPVAGVVDLSASALKWTGESEDDWSGFSIAAGGELTGDGRPDVIIGAYLIGVHHAPEFAGLAPMAAGLDDVLLPLLENLRHTPVYIIHGARDQVMPVQMSRTIVDVLGELGIAYVYREHERVHPQAGGHFFPREELPDLVAWFAATKRTPYPARLTCVRDASHLLPFGWTRIDATDRIAAFSEQLIDRRDEDVVNRRYARIEAQIAAPNRIEVRTRHVRRYTLSLNGSLVDFRKPVTVVTNGQVSYEGPVAASVETLLRDARHRQDRYLLFPAKLTIAVEQEP